MMKFTKKQLAAVDCIGLSVSLDAMDDTQFDAYCKHLEKFVINYPGAQQAVKDAFEAREQAAFSRSLLSITGMLTNIGVSDCVQAGMEVLGKYREAKFDEASALLNDLLTTVSTLSIEIQMACHKDAATAGKPGAAFAAGEDSGKKQKSILAVDDVSLLLNTLKSMLADSGYKFAGALSGNAALKYLEKNTPDLFLLDIEMPGMNGYELAGKIRELGHKAPIIFLTGNSTSEDLLKAIQAGAADFIVKPVNKKFVLDKIRKFI